MTVLEFVQLVSRMRAKQREYFKTGATNLISECRDYERRVDAAAKELLATPSLFEPKDPPKQDATRDGDTDTDEWIPADPQNS